MTRQEVEVIVGLDVGFGYTKTVTGAGVDVSPSVVGEWMPAAFRRTRCRPSSSLR